MKIFSDFPVVYGIRLKRMYRKGVKRILACPNLYKINHLLGPCKLCRTGPMHQWEPRKILKLADRRYTVHDDEFEIFCLKALVAQRVSVYTSLEFPTPKIAYRSITRIPQFYDAHTATLLDCFRSEEEFDKIDAYFLTHAYKICSSMGLYYHQVMVTPDRQMVTRSKQPREFDEQLLLEKLYAIHARKNSA